MSNRPGKHEGRGTEEVIVQRKLNVHIYFTPWQFIWEHKGGPIQDIKAGVKEVRRGGYLLELKVRLTPARSGRTRREADSQIPRCVSEKGRAASGGFLCNCFNDLNALNGVV